MKLKKCLTIISIFLFLLIPKNVFACGLCFDSRILWFFPFIFKWLTIFSVWFVGSCLFYAIARFKKLPIKFYYSKYPRRSFFIKVAIFVGVLFFSSGSLMFTMLVVVFPGWILGFYRRIKETWIIKERGVLLNVFLGFNVAMLIFLLIILGHSYVGFNSTERLLMKLSGVREPEYIRTALAKKGDRALEEMMIIIENYPNRPPEKEYVNRFLIVNLMKVARKMEDRRIIPVIEKMLDKITYDKVIEQKDIFVEGVKTIYFMDIKLALKIINAMFQDIQEMEKDPKIRDFAIKELKEALSRSMNINL